MRAFSISSFSEHRSIHSLSAKTERIKRSPSFFPSPSPSPSRARAGDNISTAAWTSTHTRTQLVTREYSEHIKISRTRTGETTSQEVYPYPTLKETSKMKFVLATAVAVACLNLALGSRQLRELSSCQQELRRLQCTANLPSPPPEADFASTDPSNTTNTTTAAPTTRRLALCHRRLSQCQANLPAATPAPVTTAPAVSFRTVEV